MSYLVLSCLVLSHLIRPPDDEKALTVFDKAPIPVVKGDSLRVVCRANLWLYQALAIHRVQPHPPTTLLSTGGAVQGPPSVNVTTANTTADGSSNNNNDSLSVGDELGYDVQTTEKPRKALSYKISHSRWVVQ